MCVPICPPSTIGVGKLKRLKVSDLREVVVSASSFVICLFPCPAVISVNAVFITDVSWLLVVESLFCKIFGRL